MRTKKSRHALEATVLAKFGRELFVIKCGDYSAGWCDASLRLSWLAPPERTLTVGTMSCNFLPV